MKLPPTRSRRPARKAGLRQLGVAHQKRIRDTAWFCSRLRAAPASWTWPSRPLLDGVERLSEVPAPKTPAPKMVDCGSDATLRAASKRSPQPHLDGTAASAG